MTKPLAALILLTGIGLYGCQPSKEQYRKDFVKGCVNSYARDSSVASTEGRLLVEHYCNCLGDKLNEQMDADAWRGFNKSGDTTLSRFKALVEPCQDEFYKKLMVLPPAER